MVRVRERNAFSEYSELWNKSLERRRGEREINELDRDAVLKSIKYRCSCDETKRKSISLT